MEKAYENSFNGILKNDKASNMNLLFCFFLKIKINKIKSKREVRGLTQRVWIGAKAQN